MPAQPADITVQRARPGDCPAVAEFVSGVLAGGQRVTREDVLLHLGRAGLLLAKLDGELVGLLGLQIENLVARITDFLIVGRCDRPTVAQALLDAMEERAHDLQCEAALLQMPGACSAALEVFWAGFGYERRPVAALPRAWREAASEAPLGADGTVLMKQLRADRVLRPI
jgi:N-acetylglutamate synthase-like GNAT family acetyltransferase